MATTRRSPEEFTERSETRPVGRPVSEGKRVGATDQAQGGSSRSLPPRFAAKIAHDEATGCWLWTGALDRAGYGQVRHGGRTTSAHQAVFELLRGQGAGELDHTCRRRSCVNPDHLERVSHRENMRRGKGFAGENARKTHCKRGHAFTPENTRAHGDGNRACRECERLRKNPMGLPASSTPAAHQRQPATVIPTDWRTRLHVRSSTTGRRVAGGKSSLYVSPLADRAERRGHLTELSAHLLGVKAAVAAGDTLLEAVGDGTLWGWRSREALSHALGVPVANWDRERGRTQAERLALVERVLSELGVALVRRGGWSVSGR